MKKQIGRFSKLVRWLMASVLISGIFCLPGEVAGQNGKRFTTLEDDWYVTYTVTIQGHGTEEPELGSGGSVIKWVVDRTYTGTSKLIYKGAPIGSIGSAGTWDAENRKKGELHPRFEKGITDRRAVINDSIEKTGDPTCTEYEVTTETWKVDATPTNPFEHGNLTVHNEDLTHDVNLPVKIWWPAFNFLEPAIEYLRGTRNPSFYVVYRKKTVSYPSKEEEIDKPKIDTTAKNIHIPEVNDWLKDGKLFRLNKPLLQEKTNYFFADSTELPVNETLLDGVDTTGKVKIRITYSLTLDPD